MEHYNCKERERLAYCHGNQGSQHAWHVYKEESYAVPWSNRISQGHIIEFLKLNTGSAVNMNKLTAISEFFIIPGEKLYVYIRMPAAVLQDCFIERAMK